MDLQFIKADPCGNVTVFVLDQVTPSWFGALARQIMAPGSVGAEQVGFLRPATQEGALGRLEMMGGEFCGNATRCFAAWLVAQSVDGEAACASDKERLFAQREVFVESTGSAQVLKAVVRPINPPAYWDVSLDMPLPVRLFHEKTDTLGWASVVVYEGITHVIVWNRAHQTKDVDSAGELFKRCGIETDCYGILYYNEKSSFMRPMVYVAASDTLVWETSCGSGSCAVGCALADRQNLREGAYQIHQPGGTLKVSLQKNGGNICRLILSGPIKLTVSGTVHCDNPFPEKVIGEGSSEIELKSREEFCT